MKGFPVFRAIGCASFLSASFYPNGVVASYAYDTLGRLTALTHRTSAQTIIDGFTYTHDAVGNRLTMADATGLHGYQYDRIYQLTRATHPNLTEAYTYDRTGNRVTETRVQGTVNYTTASDNRIQTRGSESYAHDQNGNMISGTDSNGTTTYEYDYENRLKKAVMPNGTVGEYRYDPFGRRVEKKVNGVVTRYLYDKEDIIAEYDGGVNLAARYVHGPGIDEPLSIEKNGNIYYYHTDGLGSVAALTDATGNKVQSYGYDAYGNLTSQTGTLSQPYTYTGREYDPETGLYYYRARYYDAEAGRFISRDPIGFKGGINIYVYIDNDPINYTDPSGLKSKKYWVPPDLNPPSTTPTPDTGDIDYPYAPLKKSTQNSCPVCSPTFHANVYWSCVGNLVTEHLADYGAAFGGMVIPNGFTQALGSVGAFTLSNKIGYTCHNVATYCD